MACSKIRYADQLSAQLALATVNRKAAAGDNRRDEQRPYHCAICHAWHLTSQPHAA